MGRGALLVGSVPAFAQLLSGARAPIREGIHSARAEMGRERGTDQEARDEYWGSYF